MIDGVTDVRVETMPTEHGPVGIRVYFTYKGVALVDSSILSLEECSRDEFVAIGEAHIEQRIAARVAALVGSA
jgi:hypothetical protein